MKLTFLGVAGLLDPGFNSNIFLESKYANVLIDAGMDIKQSFLAANKKVADIDALYISHLHSDHFGGLEYIGLYTYYILKKKIELYIHNSLYMPIFEALKDTLGGIGSSAKENYLERCFTVRRVPDHKVFMIGELHFTPVKNKHIDTEVTLKDTGLAGPDMFSYGLVIDQSYGYDFCQNPREVKSIYISTDTINSYMCDRWPDSIKRRVEDVDVIFHDCDLKNYGGVHPKYSDLKNLPAEIKEKMWLYHYSKSDLGVGVALDGFAGLVAEGQVFEF
tara:strand:+ start:62910 stop:63737 length:828 start_codon:yes stop_codon:yes gene_type:complete